MTPAATQRVFADDYSSSGQEAWRKGRRGVGGRFWAEDLLGQLRFDTLLSKTVVIPDSHIFDGPFFLRQSPRQLAVALGRRADAGTETVLPLEVRSRGSGLEEGLATFLRRPGQETLNPFVFKSLDDPVLRPLLAAELGRTPVADLDSALRRSDDVAEAVAEVVRAALHRVDDAADPDTLIGPIQEGWRRWLDEAEHVPVRTWPTYTDFSVAPNLDPITSKNLRTKAGREALAGVEDVIAGGSQHRADVSAALAGPRAVATEQEDERALTDLRLIDLWYSRGRYRALARQHGCACLLAEQLAVPAVNARQRRLRRAISNKDAELDRVELPDAVIGLLARIDSAGYGEFTRRVGPTLKRWWEAGETDDLRYLAAGLGDLDVGEPHRRVGLAQLLPGVLGPAVTFAVSRVTHDPTWGALVGGEAVGVAAVLQATSRQASSDWERTQTRILEALSERAARAA